MPSRPTDPILERLKHLHPRSIDLSLGRIRRLLAALDHPERRLPPVVHIAGTNGKGSTLAMLDAMLTAAGRRVDRYISPHLLRFNERILRSGQPIDDESLADVLERCERANAGETITHFEITTAAALLAFAEKPAEWLLLETGLGGEFDATNVVDRPRLCLLSPISMDHESYLGTTIEAIAAVKAGILKPGAPVVVGRQDPRALAVIERRAAGLGAPVQVMGRDFEAAALGSELVVTLAGRELRLPRPALEGIHQTDNAGLAVAAAAALQEAGVDEPALARGLRATRWPARLQRLERGPVLEALPAGSTLWIDGGHNPAAGEALAQTFEAAPDGRPLHVIVGMLSTKDFGAFADPLARRGAALYTVPIPGEPAAQEPAAMAAIAGERAFEATPCGSVLDAARAVARAGEPVRVLICGSLYLAGEVLRENG